MSHPERGSGLIYRVFVPTNGTLSANSKMAIRIGTWHVTENRSKWNKILKEANLDVCGLCKTDLQKIKWNGRGKFVRARERGKKESVGIVIGEACTKIDEGRKGPGIVWARLEKVGRRWIIVCAHAPTKKTDEFWRHLDHVLDIFRSTRKYKDDIVILVGTLNALVGNDMVQMIRADGCRVDIVGPYGGSAENENRQKLLQTCFSHRLQVMHTFFEQQRLCQALICTDWQIRKNVKAIGVGPADHLMQAEIMM